MFNVIIPILLGHATFAVDATVAGDCTPLLAAVVGDCTPLLIDVAAFATLKQQRRLEHTEPTHIHPYAYKTHSRKLIMLVYCLLLWTNCSLANVLHAHVQSDQLSNSFHICTTQLICTSMYAFIYTPAVQCLPYCITYISVVKPASCLYILICHWSQGLTMCHVPL